MIVPYLQTLDALALLAFGVVISAAFLGVKPTRRNVLLLTAAAVVLTIIQFVVDGMYGSSTVEKLYPLIIHLPLILFLMVAFKKGFIPSFFAVISACLACALSNWLGIAVYAIKPIIPLYYVAHLFFLALTGFVLIRYFSKAVAKAFTKSTKIMLIFGILPTFYYIFDLFTTVYSKILYSQIMLVSEFMPFAMCVAYLVFCVLYLKENERAHEIRKQNALLELQNKQTQRGVELIQNNAREVAIMRHDMRHFLNNLQDMLANGDIENARAYLNSITEQTEPPVIKRYCANPLINTVLSHYAKLFEDLGVDFECNVMILAELKCSEAEFTSLLANALDNAFNATNELVKENKNAGAAVKLKLTLNDEKLLLSLQNPYTGGLTFLNGAPVATQKGHGFGTESIRYTAQKLGGQCQFSATNGLFVLRVVI